MDFSKVSDEHLHARVDLTATTYRFPKWDKLGLGTLKESIKFRTLDTTITESDVLRALVRYAKGEDIINKDDRDKHIEVVTDRIIETLERTAKEREEIEKELLRRKAQK